MRRSSRLFWFFAFTAALLAASGADVIYRQGIAEGDLEKRTRLVAELGLTDLALFTEARYTRHITQADLHSAFQDHPHAFEHFPSGSLLLPGRLAQ